jgi:Glutaminase
MKIKNRLKIRFASLLIVLTANLFTTSCQNESAEVAQPVSSASKETKLLVPFSLQREGNTALVGFVESARLYTLNLSIDGNKQNETLIREAINKNVPVTVNVNGGSNEISKVVVATQDQINKFRKVVAESKSYVSFDKAANAVIPNLTTLNTLFTKIKNESCGATGAPAVCLTFRYPVDGCFARAHRMRQILLNNGYACQKQFVYGNLAATTGTCCVRWGYHVAPLVKFKNASGVVEERIIDPSLFPNGPVTAAAWRNACVVKSCNSAASVSSFITVSSDVYFRDGSNGNLFYDRNNANANCILGKYKFFSGCTPFADNTGDCPQITTN